MLVLLASDFANSNSKPSIEFILTLHATNTVSPLVSLNTRVVTDQNAGNGDSSTLQYVHVFSMFFRTFTLRVRVRFRSFIDLFRSGHHQHLLVRASVL